jgi:beta-glucanase (GH16 family)
VAVVVGTMIVGTTGLSATPHNGTLRASLTQPSPPHWKCGGERPTKADGSRWICTFDDEFNGTALDRSQWAPQLTSNSNFTTGVPPYRACYVDSPRDISVSNGYLHLTARRTAKAFTCPAPARLGLHLYDFSTRYSAGEVTTYYGFHQTYGRFAVRAKLPQTAARGLQETLWLWPKNDTKYGGFPGSGEIDFAEFYSQYDDRVIPYIHYNYNQATVSKKTNTNIVTNDYTCLIDAKHFHVYAVVWRPGRITLTYDGHTCLVDNYKASNAASPAPFDQPFFLALTQALGVNSNRPTAKTPFPATTLIDYVRVWK